MSNKNTEIRSTKVMKDNSIYRRFQPKIPSLYGVESMQLIVDLLRLRAFKFKRLMWFLGLYKGVLLLMFPRL